ncbi:hypothetical protein ABL78_4925 [Leptomonas seymouri]|uniref:Leucine-rich repeat protein n=1 Tax=Leptomonas seymouri TaxID=5684 RepID=A0A0N1PBJ4_LEPSE|nr:hypothetical protein ABL78_4925 [Leptomonas seymouri]|eukprot:KPI86022.1 hypothetical protein ABL78_4925 [Leptomonas seymouri]
MPPAHEFQERLAPLFALELRRQGVPDADEWVHRLQTHCSYTPANTYASVDREANTASSSARHPSHAPCVLAVDMTSVAMGDRPAVALCEALLKVEGPNARQRFNDVVEWQVLWRRCGLTDRALHHLMLLVSGCPKLALLDVSGNAFSEDGRMRLLHAAAEVPCSVIVTDDVHGSGSDTSQSVSCSRTRDRSPPSCPVSSTPPVSAGAKGSEEHQQRQQGRHEAAVAGHAAAAAPVANASNASEPPTVTGASSHLHPSEPQPQPQQLFQFPLRQLQRSPSLTATSTSFSRSQRNYASGGADALQRRRDELFGPRARTAAAHATSTTAAAAAAATATATATAAVSEPTLAASYREPVNVDADVERGTSSASMPMKAAVRSPALPSPSASPALTPPPPSASRQGVEGNAGAPKAMGDNVVRDSRPREPFEDRNDQIDIAANLIPVLDSALDLSALSLRDGTLRHAHMFGGATTVGDVLDAYERAAAQQMQRHGQDSGSSVDAELRARLPAALLGGTTYSAITVLILRQNHLTSIRPLPATLLRLDVSSNDLTELSGLHTCKMLTVLNARRNRLRTISGLEKNLGIAHLFLGHNKIQVIEGLAHLVLLETLDVTFNQLRTQSSVRMLSLCSALRHLLIRGNPLMETGMPGMVTVLRNLSPTLLVVDEQRVGSSKLADRALMQRGWGRPPNLIDCTNPVTAAATASSGSTLHYSGPSAASPALTHTATSVLSGAGGEPLERSIASSLPFTASRRREGSSSGGRRRPAPFAPDHDAVDERSLDVLHMLTRGVTAPTGYGDTAKCQHAAQRLAVLKRAEEEKERQQRGRRLTAGGHPLRRAVVTQLAEESRRYVEDTMTRRITAQQLSASALSSQAVMRASVGGDNRSLAASEKRHSVERSTPTHPSPRSTTEAVGGVDSPAPCPTLPSQAVMDPVTAEVLRRYELRNRPIRRRSTAGAKPKVAMTHAAELRAASTRRSLSASTTRQESPAPTAAPAPSITAAAAAAPTSDGAGVRLDLRRRGPGGPRAQSAASSHNTHADGDVDATLDAVYVEDMRGGDSLAREAPTESGGASSYAALRLIDKQASRRAAAGSRAFEEAEIECSPISTDPQTRQLNSLNTTASVYERSDRRDPPLPAPTHRPHPVAATHARAASTDRVQGTHRDPLVLASAPASTSPSAATARGRVAGLSSVRTDGQRHSAPTAAGSSARSTGTRDALRDPSDVEETAIYPASRSHSRGSRAGASQRTPLPISQAAAQPSGTGRELSRRGPSAAAAAAASAGWPLQEHRSPSRGGRDGDGGSGSAALIPTHAPSPSTSRSRSSSPSLQPLHIDAAQRRRVQSWCAQLAEDAGAVQEALQTLVELLEAQRQPQQPSPESSCSLPPTYLHERRRCVDIIQDSGMLADTQVPMHVVVYFGFSKSELDGETDRSADVVSREGKSEQAWLREVGERTEVLRLMHLIGDAKTCLRYVSLLVGDGRERLLQQYVDQLKESLRS